MSEKKKLTMFQAIMLFMVMTYSPLMRLPRYATQKALQAAWLTPLLAGVVLAILCLVIWGLIRNNHGKAMPEIICDILGKPLGKVVIALLLIWSLYLLAKYVYYFSARLVTSVYVGTNPNIFVIIMLIIVGYTLQSGIQVIARMNKIVFALLIIQFAIIILLLIPNINLLYLFPVTTVSLSDYLGGVIGFTGIWVYLFYFFMASDQILTTKKYVKNVAWSTVFLVITGMVLIVAVLGTFRAETLMKVPYPLLMAVKNVSITGASSGLESIFISVWTLGDYITITCFSFISLKLIKSLFNLKDSMPLLSIILIFTYLSSQFMTSNLFEIEDISIKFNVYVNTITGFVLPVFLFIIGKIRKKV